MFDQRITPSDEADDLELSLARLEPVRHHLSVETLMYEAGLAQGKQQNRPARHWQFLTVASWLLTATLTGLLWTGSSSLTVEPEVATSSHADQPAVSVMDASPTKEEKIADHEQAVSAAGSLLAANEEAPSFTSSRYATSVRGLPETRPVSLIGSFSSKREPQQSSVAQESTMTYIELRQFYADESNDIFSL